MESAKIKELRRAFDSYDLNKDGTLSIQEVQLAIENMGVPVTKQDVKEIFRECDVDGNRKISWQEFKAYSGY